MSRVLPPRTGEPPTKVVFEGVQPGSLLAHALLDRHQPDIKKFHMKARQSLAISEQPEAHFHQALPNRAGHMRYSMNNGIEQITIKLEPKEMMVENQPTVPHEPWDFVLVEFAVPDMTHTAAYFSAFVLKDQGNPRDVALDRNGNVPQTDNPYIFYAGPDEMLVGSGESETFFSSLKIDLTKQRGRTAMTIDFYGYIGLYYADGDPVITGSNPAARVVLKTIGQLGVTPPAGGGFPINGEPIRFLLGGYTAAEVEAQFPDLAGVTDATFADEWYNFITSVWTYDTTPPHSGWQSTDGNDTVQPGDAMAQFPGDYADTITYYTGSIVKSEFILGSRFSTDSEASWQPASAGVPQVEDAPVYIDMHWEKLYRMPTTTTDPVPQRINRTAQLSTLFFRHGDPLDRVSTFENASPAVGDTNNTCYRWESSKRYPDRFKMNVVREGVPMHTIDEPTDPSIANHFGMVKLGTLNLDLEHATASWKGA